MADTAIDILSAVSETIKADAPAEVVSRVKSFFVEKEITKRTDALVGAFDKLTEARKAHTKIKADSVTYTEDGAVAREEWSKAKLDEREKSSKAIRKLEDAIEAALSGDFSKLNG